MGVIIKVNNNLEVSQALQCWELDFFSPPQLYTCLVGDIPACSRVRLKLQFNGKYRNHIPKFSCEELKYANKYSNNKGSV